MIKIPAFKKISLPWQGWTLGILGLSGIVVGVIVMTQPDSTLDEPTLLQQTVPVDVRQKWTTQIQVSGIVRPIRRVNLGPEESGKVAQLYVKEGDTVKKDQIIAQMVNDRLQVQLEQYRAQVAKAEADLAEKRAGSRPEEIEQGRARLQQAQAELTQALESSPAELSQAEAQLQSAQVKTEQARLQRDRFQELERAGVISRERWEEANTNYKTALFTNLEAQKRLQQTQVSRTQEIVRRRAAVTEAAQSLRRLQNGCRPEEIAQAVAEVQQTKAQRAQYQIQLNNTLLRAPFSGIITRRFAQAGDFVTPTTAASSGEGATSTSIVELSSGLEVEAKVPEASIAKVQIDQPVEIRIDAQPNQILQGRVLLITPRAIMENNITSFRVKIVVLTGQTVLKPEMNVRLAIQSQPIKNARLIPLAAVMTQEKDQNAVYVLGKNNQPEKRSIALGASSGDQVQVLTGINPGDRVFTTPPRDVPIEGVDTVNFGS
jgi:HlyD family secretion protein